MLRLALVLLLLTACNREAVKPLPPFNGNAPTGEFANNAAGNAT